MEEKYQDMVNGLKVLFEQFEESAQNGKEGRGSKKHALNARKLSVNLSAKLKDFRVASIANDKEK